MILRPLAVLGGIGALALLPALPSQALAARSYTLAGDGVIIWNPAGEVKLEPGSGTAVEVLVNLMGPDAAEIRVSDEPLDGHPTLRVLYPARSIVYPPMGRFSNSSTAIRADGTWGNNGSSWGRNNLFGRRATVRGSGSGTEAWADLIVRVPRGRTISVHSIAGAAEIHDVDGRVSFDGGSGGVHVEKSSGALTLDLGSGGVEVNGFEGNLNVDTGSGSVRVSDVQGASVRLDTGSGGVTGDGIATDDLLVDTGSGSVELFQVDAKRAKVDTGSGGVEMSLLTREPELDIDTGSGSVRVSVPSDLSARLHIETGSGGIRSNLAMNVDEKDHGTLRGTVGSGAGRLHVDTGSGGVSLLASSPSSRSRGR